jgi:hypothetical protein
MNKRSHRNARAFALGLTCITACDPAKLGTLEANATTGTVGQDDDEASDDSDASTVSATGNSGDSTFPGSTTGTATTESSTGGSEAGEGANCDIFAQDCPDEQKCNPWADDANLWNAVGCFGAGDVAIGDECIVEGSGTSGVDNCVIGGMCWNVDPESNTGTCIELCSGTVDAPVCTTPATSCAILNAGVLPLCVAACDPLAQDCDDGLGCYGFDDRFGCFPDGSQEQGAYLDQCSYYNTCDPGLSCVSGDSVAGCGGAGCCTPLCDLGAPVCPETSAGCVAYFPEGEAPIGLESVGFCS